MNESEKKLHLLKQTVYLRFRDQNQEAVSLMLQYDAALVALCADELSKRGHRAAAHELRKMAREGELP